MFSKIIRRTHMYVALFLMPWMLMYALSTMAMNHRDFLRDYYGSNQPTWEKEKEEIYNRTSVSQDGPETIAKQILNYLNMDGPHNMRPSKEGQSLTIVRNDPVTPRRITYTLSDSKLLVERQTFRTPAFLERMHRRSGYQSEYAKEDAWAVTVDLVIVAMIFWVASGLWMWWELKVTRGLGAMCALAGAALFALFLFTI